MAEEARDMNEEMGRTGTAITNGIIGAIRGMNDIGAEVVNLVGNTVSNALRVTGDVANQGLIVGRDVVKGTIEATGEVAGAIGIAAATAVRGIYNGVVGGVKDVAGTVSAQRTSEEKSASGDSESKTSHKKRTHAA